MRDAVIEAVCHWFRMGVWDAAEGRERSKEVVEEFVYGEPGASRSWGAYIRGLQVGRSIAREFSHQKAS